MRTQLTKGAWLEDTPNGPMLTGPAVFNFFDTLLAVADRNQARREASAAKALEEARAFATDVARDSEGDSPTT